MHDVVFYVGIGWLAILLGLAVVLVDRAPAAAERILALDLLVLLLIGLLAVFAARRGTPFALDAALASALLSFVGTLAAARYLAGREPYE